jgi:phosphoglycerate dehydrogenase-like enzyme
MRFHIQNPPEPNQFDITEAQWLEAGGGVHSVTFGRTAEDFAAVAAEIEALIAPASKARALLACPAPRLRMLFVTSAGVDKMMPLDWLPPEVMLINNSGTHSAKVGEYALMSLLMLSARIPAYVAAQREERWQEIFTPTLDGRPLLVIGTGDLGAASARAARHFGIHATGVRTRAEPHPDFDTVITVDDLDAALASAEFVILAAPMTPATAGMMSRTRLGLLPKGACLVNIGRGGLVDQDALCDALDSEYLAGAVIDVTTPEPPPPGHRLWHTRNLIITPHVAADSPLTYNRDSLRIFMRNLAEIEAGGLPSNLVDRDKGY